jgi:hypothetical protein
MKKYFFEPRVGSRYAEKWDGYYTMILGAHQVCTANCEFKSLCTTNAGVREMDNACPVYEEGREDPYLRLSNGNRIEMDAYIENAANYPAYSSFTKYMLGERGFVSVERRAEFWERVVFCNYLQHYLPDSDTPTYGENQLLFDADIEAFKQMLQDIKPQPQLIYVWSQSVAKTLRENISKIEGLKEVCLEKEAQVMEVTLFSYHTELLLSREWIRSYLKKVVKSYTQPKDLESPLDLVVYRAYKLGYISYNDEKFTIPYKKQKFSYGQFLHNIHKYLKRWDLVEACFVKLDKNGKAQRQRLRQIATTSTGDFGHKEAQDLFKGEEDYDNNPTY